LNKIADCNANIICFGDEIHGSCKIK
jgi:hypothetical protein